MKILFPESTTPSPYWKHEIRLKHLFTTDSSRAAVRRSMNAVAKELLQSPLFTDLPVLMRFRGESDLGVANELLDALYDYCDEHRIWVS